MVTRLVAVFLLVASLAPVANLIPGGERDAAYLARLEDWLLGTALCAGIGVLVWFISRARGGAQPANQPNQGGDPPFFREDQTRADLAFYFLLSLCALLVYAYIAMVVFGGRPRLIDEIVHVLQARDFASGSLTHATRLPREFFSILHEVDFGEQSYGQYPAGGPAMLVPGVWLGAEWIIGPVTGALCVFLFGWMLPVLAPDLSRGARRGTVALFAAAPFGAFMFGSYMNHATSLLWLLVALTGLSRATEQDASPWWGLVVGVGLGVAATIRPLDAVAFALPAGAWLGWRAKAGGNQLKAWVLSGVGVAIPVAALLAVNVHTTGHPLRFGYDVLWGAGHALGFHESAWGAVHTPARGVELVSLYLTRLSSYLFETPFPALILPCVGLWYAKSLRPLDRYLLICGGFVVLGYWAYWHDGVYLGPRFLFSLLPFFVLWSVRGILALRWQLGAHSPAWRGARWALATGALYALATISLVRVPGYQSNRISMRFSPEVEARKNGVSNALVLVQESWGAQLIVRMWAAGISRADTERLYANVDACRLESSLGLLEDAGVRDAEALAQLTPLLADSSAVVPTTLSPDFTEKMQPGTRYGPTCVARINEDRGGYLLYAPWRLARDSNIYARWLPGREGELLARYPGRPVYRVRRAGPAVGAPLVWEQLSLTEGQP